MTPLETKLKTALDAHVTIREQAERLIERYISPDADSPIRAVVMSELIVLFDGPEQREAQRLGEEALGEASGASA
jgi:hypothetical protein